MSDNVSFQMKFCGPAVDGGVMDVNELASTLLSMGDLIKAANNQINGEGSSVSIKIEAFQKGSFGIDFAVFADHTHKVLSFFENSDVSGALNLIAVLGLLNAGKMGLISLVKWIGNKRLLSVKENEDTAQFTLDSGEKMIVGRDVVALYRNVDIRGKMELCFARPLETEGIDSIAFSSSGEDPIVIEKAEGVYFRAPKVEGVELDESESETWVHPVNVSFKENNKWRFSDGAFTFYATMSDKDFMDKINAGLPVSAGDTFKIKVRKKQRETSEGLFTEYEVLEILEHRPAAKQLQLPMEED